MFFGLLCSELALTRGSTVKSFVQLPRNTPPADYLGTAHANWPPSSTLNLERAILALGSLDVMESDIQPALACQTRRVIWTNTRLGVTRS
ncbi:hypothetical protein DE146DRAFT_283690 [Phaeosphaeria sp. MPI-PUGE-AT-0046c]|nr:hypothetical protein DE146DRAFT_283690 [Phaeosphaeria sp. MPI-PUGE-AT-0046c]